MGYANYTKIHHNRITVLQYSGISVGWRWGTGTTNSHHNTMEWNQVDHCMQLLSDGAGIYLVGEQQGTKVLNNWVHDILPSSSSSSYHSHGLYPDECSGYEEFAYNYVHDIANYDIHCHQNIWDTQSFHDNGTSSGTNTLSGTGTVRTFDIPGSEPPNTSLYGPQN